MFVQFLLHLLLLPSLQAQPLTASLKLIQYDPFLFQLQFSEPIAKPDFQLLLNNLEPLQYILVTAEQTAATFHFKLASSPPLSKTDLQTYQLIFNSPLKIGSGRLGVDYFMLSAEKVPVQIGYPQALGLLAVIFAYLMINFTNLGLILVEFLQVYALIMFSNQVKTDLYHEISRGLFLLNPHLEDNYEQFSVQAIIFTPIVIVLVLGAAGFIVKRLVTRPTAIFKQIIYENFVYNLFVLISQVLIVPLFYNSIQFYHMCKIGQISNSSLLGKIGSFTSYLGIITTLCIIYLFLYVLNPKIGQSDQSWKKYQLKDQYGSFRKMHEVLLEDSWFRRNKSIIIIGKRLLIVGLFFWEGGFEVSVLFLEFIDIFYIFTLRPFKQEIYTNIVVGIRLVMFLFYGVVVLGNLYYSLGTITMNFKSTSIFLQAREVVFLVIVLLIFLLSFYDIYNKCSNLNYQIRLVRQQNEFKLEIVEKQKHDTNTETPKRKHLKSYDESESLSTHPKTQFLPQPQIQKSSETHTLKVSPRNLVSPKKRREGSIQKKGKGQKKESFGLQQMKNSLPIKADIEMQSLGRSRKGSSTSQTKSHVRQEKNKWKKESLLAAILKEK